MSHASWLIKRPIAHRGLHDGNNKVWENTLAAFQRSIERGFPIECDVHLTKDEKVVVFHDGDLQRLAGVSGEVHGQTQAQMRSLKIGGTAEHVPTLSDMLDLVKGQVPLVIELKGDVGHDKGLVKALANELANYKGEVAVMSFDHHLIRDFKKHMPHLPRGLTAEGLRDADIEAHFSMLAHDINFVSYNVHHLENRFIQFVRKQLKMPVITWTVKGAQEMALTKMFADQATFELMDPDQAKGDA
jgi:glycerophosphoryl diester phosphodiesterase